MEKNNSIDNLVFEDTFNPTQALIYRLHGRLAFTKNIKSNNPINCQISL